MAYYVNGTLISGANTLPKMTMAEYLALPVSERPTYWECTDKDYEDISAENVSYGSGTVKDALDNMSAEEVSYGSGTVKDALDGIKDSLTYSTSEHIVGEWIDGRPIYEITVDCGWLPNNTNKVVSLGSLGQDIFVSLQGIAIRDDKLVTYDLSGMPNLTWYVASTGVNFITTANHSVYSAYVTFRYVKP